MGGAAVDGFAVLGGALLPPPYPRGAAAVVALATGVVAVGAVSEWVAWFTWTVLSFPPPPPLLAS